MDADRSVSLNVVAKVAEREGTSPSELRPPIHSAVDTEALDAMYRSTDADRVSPSVEFTYKGYTIRVDGPDEITISDPRPEFKVTKEVV